MGFDRTIRMLYSADIPVQWGRALWWGVFGAWLAIGSAGLAMASRGWVRVVAIAVYLLLMGSALIYFGVIESAPPRLVWATGLQSP